MAEKIMNSDAYSSLEEKLSLAAQAFFCDANKAI